MKLIPPTLISECNPTHNPGRRFITKPKKLGARSEVQSVVVSKKHATTVSEARKLVPSGFKTSDVDEKKTSYRFRQTPPGRYRAFRMEAVKGVTGVQFVYGIL